MASTSTLIKQPPGGIVPPLSPTALANGAALSIPPQVLTAEGLPVRRKLAGNVSVTLAPVIAIELGLIKLMVSKTV